MAIIQICNFHDVARAFDDMGRGNNFSSEGLRVLVDYMENLSDSTGNPVELDVLAWCCEYQEDTVDDIIANYRLKDDVEGLDEEEKRDFVESYLQENTIICGKTKDGFIYQVF